MIDDGNDETNSVLARLGENGINFLQTIFVPLPVAPFAVKSVDVASPDVLALDLW